jgi:6-phosphogluconolactonase
VIPNNMYQLGYRLLGAAVLLLCAGCQSLISNNGAESVGEGTGISLIVGTYNQKGSEGIYSLSFDPSTGTFGEPKLEARADNPSFISQHGNRLYAVVETDHGALTTYSRAENGTLQSLATALTKGASPCYISLSPDGRFIATANYMGGNTSIFRLDDTGVPQGVPQVLQHQGKGPNADRQEAAHAHWAQWDPQQAYLYVVDLGIDEVKAYPFDDGAGEGFTALRLAPGDGPRHLFFHPHLPVVYVVNELSNTLVAARRNGDGTFTEFQKIGMLPASFTEHSQAAHLYVTSDGKTLYASNRGHNSIAVFNIGQDGSLNLVEIEPVLGDWPRHFLVLEDERILIVANQESHNLVAFRIESSGALTPMGKQIEIPQPTFLDRLAF